MIDENQNIIFCIQKHLYDALFRVCQEINELNLSYKKKNRIKNAFLEYFNAIENDLIIYDLIHEIEAFEEGIT